MGFLVRKTSSEDDAFIEGLAKAEGLSVHPVRERELLHSRLLVAFEDDPSTNQMLLGFVLAWQAGDELEIHDLAVCVEARRRRIGATLVGAVLGQAALEGVQNAFLEVNAENTAARRLYEGLGFSQFITRKDYYPGGGDALVLRLALPPLGGAYPR